MITKKKLPSLFCISNAFIILLSSFFSLKAQKSVPDSLLKKTYDELKDIYVPMDRDSLSAIPYVKAFMAKAKAENDTIKIARAYMDMGWISKPNVERQYADSIILLTENFSNKIFPAYGYATKAKWQYENGLFKESLDNYLKAYESALRSGNQKQQNTFKFNIAAIKDHIGNYKEALDIYEDAYKHFGDTINNEFATSSDYSLLVFNLYNTYSKMGNLDSAKIYLTKGLEESIIQKDTLDYYKFYANKGILSYYEGSYQKAKDILSETLPYRKGEKLCMNYYYRAKSNQKMELNMLALKDLKIIDSIVETNNYRFPELLDVYKTLSNHYESLEDFDNQLKYINKYIAVDSTIDTDYKRLNQKLFNEYNIPELERKKDKAARLLDNKSQRYQTYLYYFSVVLVLLVILLIYYLRKQRKLKKRFQNLIYETNVKKNRISAKKNKIDGLADELISDIRKQLTQFEREKGFLSNTVNLSILSKKLNTNSSYLSKVINVDKSKNFATYINDLRIDFSIERLKTSAQFRKFTIKSISEEIGFNNPESYSKAFYKKTDMYPSYFIKQLEKHELSSRNS